MYMDGIHNYEQAVLSSFATIGWLDCVVIYTMAEK